MSNNPYYLHFVTDLKRVVFCMNNNDKEGAKNFLHHAHKIFKEKLSPTQDKELNIDATWLELYNNEFPNSKKKEEQYCKKLNSLTSMIFMRSI